MWNKSPRANIVGENGGKLIIRVRSHLFLLHQQSICPAATIDPLAAVQPTIWHEINHPQNSNSRTKCQNLNVSHLVL